MTTDLPMVGPQDLRSNAVGRSLPGRASAPALEAEGIAADGETDLASMLLKFEERAFFTEVALRVQAESSGKQPLAKVDVTDLALMIVTGATMSRAFAAAEAGQAPISAMPGAYGQGF